LRRRAHILWLWVAVDPSTKLIPGLHLGSRTQVSAHAMIHDLRQRLASGCLPVFTSDGLNQYFYALTAHFGQWVATTGRRARQWQVATGLMYGQVKKCYRRYKIVRVTQVMRCGTRAALTAALQDLGLSGRLNTACIERVNLTLRQSVAALVRRTCRPRRTRPSYCFIWNGGVGSTTSCAPTRPYAWRWPSRKNGVADECHGAIANAHQRWQRD
jgi:IS1 family transposase